jgi:protein-S-isoprenylcysteine O-methyltransferase Ste14
VTVVLAVLAVPSGGGLSSGEKEDRGNRWVLGAFSVIALLMAFFSSYTDRSGLWTLDGDVLRWVRVVLCYVDRLLRIIPVYVLRTRFGGLVAIQPGHRLETHGDLWRDPQPELLGAAHYVSGVSADVSLWRWNLAGGCVTSAASGTDPSRGKVAARALRRRVRCLL